MSEKMTVEQARAYFGNGAKKPPPPIRMDKGTKMPKEGQNKPAVATQLEQTDLDVTLSEIVIKTLQTPAYVAVFPSRIEITLGGHDLVLVPREQVDKKYLQRDNS